MRAHGKNLYGIIEGGYYFYSHLMMWGRWQIVPASESGAPDRRERARLVNDECAAILLSAPVFEIGEGEPYAAIEYLRALGPDTLPYDGAPFDSEEFLRRLLSETNRQRDIGAALLDQTIAAGIGNYLRAEILFQCRLDPFARVEELPSSALDCLCATISSVVARAYEWRGVTIDDEQQARLQGDPTLSYPGTRDRQMAARHAVFRRTNLPCLVCGDSVRQLRQVTHVAGDDEDGSLNAAPEKSRIIYFCPTCQGVNSRSAQAASRRKKAMNDSLFIAFAQTAERIAATPKRLEKAAILGEYFSRLNDDDLARTARYYAGYLFSLRDQRVVNVGGAMLLAAALAVTDSEEAALRTRLVETGDFGDALFDFWPDSGPPQLTLQQVAEALETLAATTGSKAKLALVIALLRLAATPLEGKYLVKLLSGDLRVRLARRCRRRCLGALVPKRYGQGAVGQYADRRYRRNGGFGAP